MTKLFRKVRQKMFTKNKFSNYLAYAIGEIILVVLGILIALQINTIHQNWKRAKLEKVLLEQVKLEMLTIYEDLWRDATRLEIGNKSHATIQQYITQDAPYVDSLCFDFYLLKLDEYIYPSNAAYNKLQEEGLDIIKNDTIRFYIQGIYESIFPRIMKGNSFTPDISMLFNDYYLHSFKPNKDYKLTYRLRFVNDTVGSRIYTNEDYTYPQKDSRNEGQYKTIGYVPLNFEALKKDTKFHMLLDEAKEYRDYKIKRYSFAKSGIKEIVNMIDRELRVKDSSGSLVK